jgi:hypothetical protein
MTLSIVTIDTEGHIFIVMLSFIILYATLSIMTMDAECQILNVVAECRYAECRFTECCGAQNASNYDELYHTLLCCVSPT